MCLKTPCWSPQEALNLKAVERHVFAALSALPSIIPRVESWCSSNPMTSNAPYRNYTGNMALASVANNAQLQVREGLCTIRRFLVFFFVPESNSAL